MNKKIILKEYLIENQSHPCSIVYGDQVWYTTGESMLATNEYHHLLDKKISNIIYHSDGFVNIILEE